jgi:hypothetical protein
LSYPSDIYSVKLDGTDLKRLTHSAMGRDTRYANYYYMPRYSPDGSQILVWGEDRQKPGPDTSVDEEKPDSAVIMSPDGSHMRVVTEGKPLGWAASGKAIFVVREEEREEGLIRYVVRCDLTSGKTQVVKGIEGAPLGKLRADDTFAVDNYGWLGLVTVSAAATGPIRTLPLPTTAKLEVDDLKALRPNVKPEALSTFGALQLEEVSSDISGSYLVLVYRGDIAEVTQVVKIK